MEIIQGVSPYIIMVFLAFFAPEGKDEYRVDKISIDRHDTITMIDIRVKRDKYIITEALENGKTSKSAKIVKVKEGVYELDLLDGGKPYTVDLYDNFPTLKDIKFDDEKLKIIESPLSSEAVGIQKSKNVLYIYNPGGGYMLAIH